MQLCNIAIREIDQCQRILSQPGVKLFNHILTSISIPGLARLIYNTRYLHRCDVVGLLDEVHVKAL